MATLCLTLGMTFLIVGSVIIVYSLIDMRVKGEQALRGMK